MNNATSVLIATAMLLAASEADARRQRIKPCRHRPDSAVVALVNQAHAKHKSETNKTCKQHLVVSNRFSTKVKKGTDEYTVTHIDENRNCKADSADTVEIHLRHTPPGANYKRDVLYKDQGLDTCFDNDKDRVELFIPNSMLSGREKTAIANYVRTVLEGRESSLNIGFELYGTQMGPGSQHMVRRMYQSDVKRTSKLLSPPRRRPKRRYRGRSRKKSSVQHYSGRHLSMR